MEVKKSQELPIDVVICHLREYQFVTPCDLKLELQNEKTGKMKDMHERKTCFYKCWLLISTIIAI